MRDYGLVKLKFYRQEEMIRKEYAIKERRRDRF